MIEPEYMWNDVLKLKYYLFVSAERGNKQALQGLHSALNSFKFRSFPV